MPIRKPVQELVISTAIYAADDALAPAVVFEFDGVQGGCIRGVAVIDDDTEAAELKVWIFNRPPAAQVANAALALDEEDFDNLIDVITLPAANYETNNGTSIVVDNSLEVCYDNGAGRNRLWVLVTPTGTPTYTATSDIRVRLTVDVF